MAGLYIRYLLRIIGGEGCTPGFHVASVRPICGGYVLYIFCGVLPRSMRASGRFQHGGVSLALFTDRVASPVYARSLICAAIGATRANMCAVRVGFPVSLQCCPRTQWGREFPQLGRIIGRVYSVLNVLYVFHVYIVYDV